MPVDVDRSRELKHPNARLLGYRMALAVIASMLLFIAAMLPLTLASVLTEVFGESDSEVYRLAAVPHSAAAPTHTDLHVAVVDIDAAEQAATLLVSGHHVCPAPCAWSDRVVLFAIGEDEAATEGLPPSVSVTLPPNSSEVSQKLELPVRGKPVRYPFDVYELQLGVLLQRVLPDGTIQTMAPTEATGHLFLSLEGRLPHQAMATPVPIPPETVRGQDDPYEYHQVVRLVFERPRYFRVLSLLLVLLISASAVYAVFMRTLHELVVNAGALVLGVWGIRSILIPENLRHVTAVDLALSLVLLFVLGAITVRASRFVHGRSGLEPYWRRHGK